MTRRRLRNFGFVVAAAAAVGLTAAPGAMAKGTAYIAGAQNIDAETIAADGSISPAAPVVSTGAIGAARGVAVTPDAQHVFVAGANGSAAAFNVGANGTLTAATGSPFASGSTDGRGLAVTPDGRFLYMANGNGGAGQITRFQINADGTLANPVNTNVIDAPKGLAISPDGTHLFASGTPVAAVSAFSIASDGTLTAVGTPGTAQTGPEGVALTPDGKFLYVANSGSASVTAFAVSGPNLTALGNVPTGANVPETLAVSQDGRFVFVANSAIGANISAYSINPDGTLAPAPGQPFQGYSSPTATPYGIDAAPNGLVYSDSFENAVPNRVNVFSVGVGGALTNITGSPFTSQVSNVEFQSIAISPNQGPVAAVTSTPAAAGSATTLDASASADTDGGGAIGSFVWDFGDGQTETTTTATTTHVYAAAGNYTASVRVVDPEGCSNAFIFTGQTADCNGTAAAVASTQLTVPGGGGPGPGLRLSGPKTQKLDGAVEVGARCDEPCTANATGKLIVRTPSGGRIALAVKRFNLKPASIQLNGKKKGTLALKVPRKVRRAGLRALKRGGRVRARITVSATNNAGGTTTVKRGVRLVKKR